MPLVLADRVNETTTTTSTGTITLAGAVSGYQSFAVIGNGNTTYYTIVHQTANEWEVGIGTYTSSGTTLARNTVLASSNSGSLVNFSAGTKFVFCDYPAGRAVYLDTATNVTIPGLTLSSGNLAFTSTAQRITADMSNGTVSNRFAFQTSTTNGNTQVNAIPNGTSTTSQFIAYNSSDPNNASSIQIAALSTATRLLSGQTGTGTYLPLTFFTNGSEQARFDTSGNFGIGTASPAYKLDVTGTSTTALSAAGFTNNSSANNTTKTVGITFRLADTVGFIKDSAYITAFPDGANVLSAGVAFSTRTGDANPTEKMRLDSSGNLGLGVTPSAWSGVGAALQVGLSAAIIGNSVNSSSFISNAYFDGTNYRYIGTGFAQRLALTSGAYSFQTAASGTAGSAITFTTGMTLDSSGNLGIGTASPGARLDVVTGTARWQISNDGSGNIVEQFLDSTGAAYRNLNSYASNHILYTSGTERMRLDSSGNLGIGTASPATKLTVYGSAGAAYIQVQDAAGVTGKIQARAGTSLLEIGTTSNNGLSLYTNNTEKALLDTSGNLGLGVTPSAWGSGSTAFQIGNGAIWKSGSRSVDWITNGYYNGTNYIYNASAAATYYRQFDGVHSWYNAASGTAGNAISFTQAMTLDSAGRFLLGASSNTSRGGSNTTALFYKASGTQYLDIQTGTSGDSGLLFSATSSSAYGLINYSNSVNAMLFYANSAEVFRITSSGNLGIGTASPVTGSRLTLNGGGLAILTEGTLPASISGVTGLFVSGYSATGTAIGRVLIGDGTGYNLYFSKRGSSTTTDLFTFTDTGNLGIGTTTPRGDLDVGTATASAITKSIHLGYSSANFYGFRLANTNTAASFGAGTFLIQRGTTAAWVDDFAIDNNGNLGIGTTSPAQLVHARKDQAAYTWMRVDNQSSSASAYAGLMMGAYGNSWGLAIGSSAANSNALTFVLDAGGTNSEKMRLDSSGNLGLGVTPNAWNAVYRAMNIGSRGFIFSRTDNQETSIGVNWYRTTAAAFVYAQNGYATSYTQLDGVHAWYNSTNNTSGADAPFTPIQAMTLTSGGALLVGSTSNIGSEITLFKQTAGTGSPVTRTWNNSTSGNNEFVEFATEASYTTRGSITYNRGAGQVAYNITSDARLKENIADSADAGGKIDAMQVRQFDWKETGNHLDYGFVAQELHNVAPHAVSKPEEEEAMWSVDYSKLVPMLVKELQSLRQRVAQLENK